MARKHGRDRGLFVYRVADGSAWYGVRVWVHGRAYKWQGFSRKLDARAWYEDRRRDVREGRPFPGRGTDALTVGSTIDRYLSQARHKKSYGNECAYAVFWTAYYRATASLNSVTSLSIEHARIQLLDTGATGKGPLSPATVNRYVAWWKHVLMLEERSGRIERNPCRAIEKLPEPPPSEEQFSLEEEQALARALGPDWECVRLAILTGLRQDEEFRLQWKYLDLAQGFGRLPDPKGGEPELFLLNDEAVGILTRRQGNGSPWVFPHRRDPLKPMNGKSWYLHVFKPACVKAGIHVSRATGKTWHTLRHTFAARLQEAKVPVGDIKELGRWKSWKAMDRYLKRGKLRLRSAIERIATAPKPSLYQGTS